MSSNTFLRSDETKITVKNCIDNEPITNTNNRIYLSLDEFQIRETAIETSV